VEKLLMENGAKATLLQRLGKSQEVAAAVFYIATQVGFLGFLLFSFSFFLLVHAVRQVDWHTPRWRHG
jgi:hypothetical protein